MRLRLEFLSVYVALPALLLAVRLFHVPLPVLPVLWAAAVPAAFYLSGRHGWGAKEFIGVKLTRQQAGHLALRIAVAAAVLTGGILLVAPEQVFELPRRNPLLWGAVMVFYPLISVYPQGLLYRGLFFARYARLFGSERRAALAGAVAFSLAHLVFANAWALVLTLAGGLLFNRTYRKTGSLMASNLEHAVYGQLVFTCGWGRYLYHGTVRLIEGLSG
jgi:membrane protease YdiL (CAAX protease family)